MSPSSEIVLVSAAFRLPAGAVGAIAARALRAINRVHGAGALPVIPIQKSAAKKRYAAMYQSVVGEGRDGKNRPIRILCSAANDAPALSLCHEVGHFLDEQGWEGAESASDALPNRFFSQWLLRVIGSGAIKDLMKLAEIGVADLYLPEGGFIEMPVDRKKILGYLLQPEEMWARCYAQYIAMKSGDALLLQQLDTEREFIRGRIYYPRHWTDADFAPILEAMDNIFRERGWLHE